ncbi:hypothetical protein CTI12_AA614270 [Artemisia annua]|uniref:Helitron helicase-like domain-containing protein n=1 Tax=Artemisia annua TaxID=35608 RepID=A0A2U1KDU1_ARTAN|nr:hypothetical protein CTI12_AA614270 [Artemisia annua]
MKIQRKVVPNKTAEDIPIEASQCLGFPGSHSDEVSGSTSFDYSVMTHAVGDGTPPVSCPIISTSIASSFTRCPAFCDTATTGSSTDQASMEIGQTSSGYGILNAPENARFNKEHLLVTAPPHQIDLPHGVPAQVRTVDGLVSTFQVANIVLPSSVAARQPTITEGLGNVGNVGHVPMVLDFSAGHVVSSPNSAASNTRISSRQRRIPARMRRRTGRPRLLADRQRTPNGTLYIILYLSYLSLLIFVYGVPPTDVHRFMYFFPVLFKEHRLWRTQMARQCKVLLRLHNEKALRESVIEGLIGFLNDNNALVKLFRTARDKLQQADIPNFSIRLFGVVGANQYELPTADSIGAIVYEGGPETMTDYDVVIERHSGEPESVNKLHPAYMALQFPLLFIYGEEGYHLKLTLRSLDGDDEHQQKKMSMKVN